MQDYVLCNSNPSCGYGISTYSYRASNFIATARYIVSSINHNGNEMNIYAHSYNHTNITSISISASSFSISESNDSDFWGGASTDIGFQK